MMLGSVAPQIPVKASRLAAVRSTRRMIPSPRNASACGPRHEAVLRFLRRGSRFATYPTRWVDRGDFMTNTQTRADRHQAVISAAQGRTIDWSKIAIWFAVPIATWSGIIASLWWTL
jgi:hypothetical protein